MIYAPYIMKSASGIHSPVRIHYPEWNHNLFSTMSPVSCMNSGKFSVILLALACIAILIAGCTTTTTIGNPAPAQTSVPAAPAATPAAQAPAATAAPVAAATTPACPDKEVLTGSWDTREVGYASNHDVREGDVWTDGYPQPMTLTQKCWDVTGTYTVGSCPGTITGKIEKNVFTGKFAHRCTTDADSFDGTFSATMAADNQSFIGAWYRTGVYGPEYNFPPSWIGRK